MQLARRKNPKALISMTALIDVMLILLVFFMVTSTYLDLDMVPMVQSSEETEAPPNTSAAAGAPLLVQLTASGQVRLRGQVLEIAALAAQLADMVADNPGLRVLVLPSGAADAQALVGLIDAATTAGVADLRVIRPEGGQ
ncbi:MAG: biopolymer transporter ExbD [Paracoccaceae bacterium]